MWLVKGTAVWVLFGFSLAVIWSLAAAFVELPLIMETGRDWVVAMLAAVVAWAVYRLADVVLPSLFNVKVTTAGVYSPTSFVPWDEIGAFKIEADSFVVVRQDGTEMGYPLMWLDLPPREAADFLEFLEKERVARNGV